MRSLRKRLFTTTNIFACVDRFLKFFFHHVSDSFPGKDFRKLRQHPLFQRSITVSATPRRSQLRLPHSLKQLVLPPGNSDGVDQGFLYSFCIMGIYLKFYSALSSVFSHFPIINNAH